MLLKYWKFSKNYRWKIHYIGILTKKNIFTFPIFVTFGLPKGTKNKVDKTIAELYSIK
jgi:hypothetical protein